MRTRWLRTMSVAALAGAIFTAVVNHGGTLYGVAIIVLAVLTLFAWSPARKPRVNGVGASGQQAHLSPQTNQQAQNPAPASSPPVLAVRASGQTRISQRLNPSSE